MLFHEVGEDTGVGGEAGEGYAVVCVNGDHFALVGREFFCVALDVIMLADVRLLMAWLGNCYLECGEDCVCLADDADDY